MLILLATAFSEVVALVLRFTGWKRCAAWAVAAATLPALSQMAIDFSQDALRGVRMTPSDVEFLALELAILSMAILSLWRGPRIFFWLAWSLNLAFVGVLIYLVFFFHIF